MKTAKVAKNNVKKEVIENILLKKTVGGGAICAAACVYSINKTEPTTTTSGQN